jgi:hypothetical protein
LSPNDSGQREHLLTAPFLALSASVLAFFVASGLFLSPGQTVPAPA